MMNEEKVTLEGAVCPIPKQHGKTIVLGHGSGGKLSASLIQNIFQPPLANPTLLEGNDAGVVQISPELSLAVSTDGHVISPLFFPGGDIGKLAVCGTVNDVAMMGAEPKYLSASFILEEGFEIHLLEKIVQSMKSAAEEAGIEVICGDTKVVPHGDADGVYISTTGVGLIKGKGRIGGSQAQPGDQVIISGTMGDHGIAVLEARGELGFKTGLTSDVAPLNGLVQEMLQVSSEVHVLRDPTRGGVATALNEIACQSRVSILLDEKALPVKPEVAGASELLGFDPLYIANEGKLLAVASPCDVAALLEVMHNHPYGKSAVVIGEVQDTSPGKLLLKTGLGSTRIVDTLSGEMLPRIC